jgi:hypothetical protein
MKCVALLFAVGVVCSASVASAQPAHDFHTLDRLTPVSSVDVDVGYERWKPNRLFTEWVNQATPIEVHAHYLEDVTTLVPGNPEVGAMYAGDVARDTDVVGHLGVACSTSLGEDYHLATTRCAGRGPTCVSVCRRWAV